VPQDDASTPGGSTVSPDAEKYVRRQEELVLKLKVRFFCLLSSCLFYSFIEYFRQSNPFRCFSVLHAGDADRLPQLQQASPAEGPQRTYRRPA
jgi:hypothetical protein